MIIAAVLFILCMIWLAWEFCHPEKERDWNNEQITQAAKNIDAE